MQRKNSARKKTLEENFKQKKVSRSELHWPVFSIVGGCPGLAGGAKLGTFWLSCTDFWGVATLALGALSRLCVTPDVSGLWKCPAVFLSCPWLTSENKWATFMILNVPTEAYKVDYVIVKMHASKWPQGGGMVCYVQTWWSRVAVCRVYIFLCSSSSWPASSLCKALLQLVQLLSIPQTLIKLRTDKSY